MPKAHVIGQVQIALLLGLAHATTASAQPATRATTRSARTAVELAAIRFVRSRLLADTASRPGGARALIFDQRVGHSDAYLTKGRPHRSNKQAHRLAAALGAQLVDGDRALGCDDDRDAGTCHLRADGPALVRLGRPVIRGDSAFTPVTVWRGVEGGRDKVAFVHYNLTLVSDGGRWRVVPRSANQVVRS